MSTSHTQKKTDYLHLVERQEFALHSIREVCRNTPLYENSKIGDVHQLPLQFLRLQRDTSSIESLGIYQSSYIPRRTMSTGATIRPPCGWARWSTEDRIGFLNHVQSIVTALDGQPLSVQFEKSYRWRHFNDDKSPCSPPEFIHTYGLFIIFDQNLEPKKKNHSNDFLSSGPKICRSNDSRADKCVIKWLQEHGSDVCNGGYEWTSDGFIFTSFDFEVIDKLKQVFSDCRISVSKSGKGSDVHWSAEVVFPI